MCKYDRENGIREIMNQKNYLDLYIKHFGKFVTEHTVDIKGIGRNVLMVLICVTVIWVTTPIKIRSMFLRDICKILENDFEALILSLVRHIVCL